MTKPKEKDNGATRPVFDWASIRAEYETGKAVAWLARKWKCSRTAISKRAEKEKWTVDAEAQIQRVTKAKLAKVDRIVDPVTKSEAIDAEADRRVAIIEGHRELFAKCRVLVHEALDLRKVRKVSDAGKLIEIGGTLEAFNAMKLAKITTEAARNIMLGERMAYGIAEGEERQNTDLPEDDKELLKLWQSEHAKD
jgi:hypothetical protein